MTRAVVVNAAQLATYSQAKQNLLATGMSRNAHAMIAITVELVDRCHDNDNVSVQRSGTLCKLKMKKTTSYSGLLGWTMLHIMKKPCTKFTHLINHM